MNQEELDFGKYNYMIKPTRMRFEQLNMGKKCVLGMTYHVQKSYLVGGLKHVFYFSMGIVIPTDELIFLGRGRYSTNQIYVILTSWPIQVLLIVGKSGTS